MFIENFIFMVYSLMVHLQNLSKKIVLPAAWINQPWILEQFLRLAKNESIIRRQDFFTCLSYINKNPIGNNL